MSRGEVEEFDGVEAKRETDKALLCVFEGGREEWIPKSQIDDESKVRAEGDLGTLVVTKWIAEQKGLG